MTSKEIITFYNRAIEKSSRDLAFERDLPLWEIALQLAERNERDAAADNEAVNRMLRRVGLGGLTVGGGREAPNQYVVAIESPFPFVRSDGVRDGREWFGVWYGPGPSARSFPNREAAEKHLEENPPLAAPTTGAGIPAPRPDPKPKRDGPRPRPAPAGKRPRR